MRSFQKAVFSGLGIMALFMSMSCHGSERDQPGAEIKFTFLKECKDKTGNADAAFSESACPDLAGYRVEISEQSPRYFNIHLIKNNKRISSDFTMVTGENPLEPGKAIEWHLYDNKPKFMVFRLSWGTEDQPFEMQARLVINLVTEDEICVIDQVEVARVKNANQVARDLISRKYKGLAGCPN